MKLEFFIARRHITSSGGAFRKVISGISIGGVVVGVGCLLIVMSVENGFHKNLQDKILTATPEVMVLRFHRELISDYQFLSQRIQKIQGVKDVKPFIYTKGILKSRTNQAGIVLRGIPENQEIKNLDGELDGLVLGKSLADELGAFLYDTLTLFGISQPSLAGIRSKKFKVTGIFDAGLYEYNASLAYLPLKATQDFLGFGDKVTRLELKLSDIYNAPEIAKTINKEIGYPYYTKHWIELNSNLFSTLRLEKTTFFILLLLIIVVACFGIAATLIMLITQKTREIGVLRALGATSKSIKKMFMLEGMLIGVIGTAMGTVIGWGFSFLLSKYHFLKLPPGVSIVYGLETLPVYMKLWDFVLVGLGAIFISFLASLYPASRASRLLPSEAIRYE
ncbi:ABC transporter permease [candidate division WOR-3 bacterium]|nr:ABC transporter permease [candidate division WOR-3 bacterium]